jgi:hypothetical protein
VTCVRMARARRRASPSPIHAWTSRARPGGLQRIRRRNRKRRSVRGKRKRKPLSK